jgi:hypothetical protein
MGLGNIALIRLASAQLKVTEFQQIEILNQVRADVAEAYARTHARYNQIATYEDAVRSGYLAYREDLDRTISMGGNRPRDVLPIELLNSFDLLANARVEYVDAIVDYNRAQFAMYVALGQPPANVLARPVPVDGVVPTNVPAPSAAPGAAPAVGPNRPQAANSARNGGDGPLTGRNSAGARTAIPGAGQPDRPGQQIPPPRDLAGALNANAR